jgi:hypothetical protein
MIVHPNLQVEVGNVSVIYVSRNSIVHLYQTDQPIFSATEEVALFPDSPGFISKYEERLGVIACVERLQLCRNDGHRECSLWTGPVRGVNGETGIEDFYSHCSSDDRGMISIILPKTTVAESIGIPARATGSQLVALRSVTSFPSDQGQSFIVQTTKEKEMWKREVAQCEASRWIPR